MNTSLYANGFLSAKGFMLSAIALAFTTVTGCDQQAADNLSLIHI